MSPDDPNMDKELGIDVKGSKENYCANGERNKRKEAGRVWRRFHFKDRRNNRDKNRGRNADFTIFLFSVMSANQKVRCIQTAMIPLRFKKYEIQQTSWRSHGLIDACFLF